MAKARYAWAGECTKGHRDLVWSYDPDVCPGLPYCDWNIRDDHGRIIRVCNANQYWEPYDAFTAIQKNTNTNAANPNHPG